MNDKIKDLIVVLDLKKDRRGLYKTSWGRKSEEGLIATIKNVLGLKECMLCPKQK